jgi:parallel beta-helix repeat protein
VSTSGADTNAGTITSPWRTPAKAASVVLPGTTVYLRQGTYAPFTITRSGLAGSPITFRAYPGETATVAGNTTRPTVILVTSGAHDVVIQGLTVQGAPSQWGAGIRVDGAAHHVSILNNVLRDNRSFGIKLANVQDITVRGNEITRNETGVEISLGGDGIVVDANRIHTNDRMVVNTVGGNDDRGANAVVLYKTTGVIRVTGNMIWNNRATSYDYGYDGGAFEIYGASNVVIDKNVMWNNENVLETGTDVLACDNNRFTRNTAFGGAKTGPTMGLILRCASDMLVAGNSLYDLDRFVFDITAQAQAFGGSIDGLRIVNNAAVSISSKIYSIDSAMPASVVINHGISRVTSGGSIAYVYGKGNTTSLATFTSWTGFEQAGHQADPQFVDPVAGNLSLRSSSPAIDKGVIVAGVTDGYTGSGPDLGAHEYRP